MTRNLNRILTGVGVRCPENGKKYFIQNFITGMNVSKDYSISLLINQFNAFIQRTKYLLTDVQTLWTTYSYYCNCSPNGCCRGTNSFFQSDHLTKSDILQM